MVCQISYVCLSEFVQKGFILRLVALFGFKSCELMALQLYYAKSNCIIQVVALHLLGISMKIHTLRIKS